MSTTFIVSCDFELLDLVNIVMVVTIVTHVYYSGCGGRFL
jgi:hypothetical protein